MSSDTCHLSLIEHDDLVGMADRSDTLCHDHAGGTFQVSGKSSSQFFICFIIQGGEGIVKNQDLRISGDRTGDRKPLFLTS